jgi:hypothetical protein
MMEEPCVAGHPRLKTVNDLQKPVEEGDPERFQMLMMVIPRGNGRFRHDPDQQPSDEERNGFDEEKNADIGGKIEGKNQNGNFILPVSE